MGLRWFKNNFFAESQRSAKERFAESQLSAKESFAESPRICSRQRVIFAES